jgi:hypothetical protein
LILPALPGLPRELPALPGLPCACEFPVPERAFAAAVSLKHGRQNLARLLLALRPHRLKFWHFFPFIAFMTYLCKHLKMDSNLFQYALDPKWLRMKSGLAL